MGLGALTRRPVVGPALEAVMALALIVAFGVVLLIVGGADPGQAVEALWQGAFGGSRPFGETLIRFAPFALLAAALAPSLKAGLFNIGAPGQIGMGAFAATMVSLYLDSLPGPLLLALAALAAALGGTLWGIVPAWLRARMGVNEILSTLVFNFIALGILSYLLSGPLQAEAANIAQSEPLPEKANLPILIPDTRAHIFILLGLVAVVALAAFQRTPSGYRLRLFSGSPSLAAQAGASETRLILVTICIGAAAAGLVGWMQVAGVDHRLYATVAAPIGYTALFVALLGRLHPLGILAAAFGFAALMRGGESLQVGAGVSPEMITALIGFILLVAAARAGRAVGARAGT